MRLIAIPAHIEHYVKDKIEPAEVFAAYQRLRKTGVPDVSISIPAYNEEETLVQTLASLCNNETDYAVEIIVTDNNSKDKTEEIIKSCGVVYEFEPRQGITQARNTGLAVTQGTYILNADADTIYPKDWIAEMVKPLVESEKIAITYGRFSFIPTADTGRFTYFIYEYIADIARVYDKHFKNEAVNVYGFNSCFRKQQALQVDCFDHPPGTNEDGYLALKLKLKGFGDLYLVKAPKAIVWTTDRRIQLDGGLIKGIFKRVRRFFS